MSIILSRPGAVQNDTGSREKDWALFREIYTGEVMSAFEENNVAMPYTQQRQINEGKSANFPIIGKTEASYHQAGDKVEGKPIDHARKTLHIAGKLVSRQDIDELEEAINHYDVRAPYSNAQGEAMARTMDKNILRLGVNAARKSANLPGALGTPDGTTITHDTNGAPSSADFRNDPDHLAKAIMLAARELDKKDVPEQSRVCFLRPDQYWTLIESNKAINRDFSSDNGDFAAGRVMQIAGISIIKTNNLPDSQITNTPEGLIEVPNYEDYAGDFTNTVGLVMHPSALGTLRLMDLAVEGEWDMDYQAHKIITKMAVGHGVLRPESAVEIADYSPSA